MGRALLDDLAQSTTVALTCAARRA
jgi:hypothetical protein